MAGREPREYDDAEVSLDPELLYTKEYCIGWSPVHTPGRTSTDGVNRRRQFRQSLQRVGLTGTAGLNIG